MNIIVNRRSLERGLAHVQDSYLGAILEARAGQMWVGTYDAGICVGVPAQVVERGWCTADAKALYALVYDLGGVDVEVAEVELADVDDALRVRWKDAEHWLPALRYLPTRPALPDLAGATTYAIDGAVLRELLARTLGSASTDGSRPHLNSVFWETVGEGRLRLVSTDGHRLSLGERDVRRGDDIPARAGVIVPRCGIVALKQLLDDVGPEVRFGFLDNHLVVMALDVTVGVRLDVEGVFPDYEKVVPKRQERCVPLCRAALCRAARRVARFAGAARLDIGGGRILLTTGDARGGAQGWAQESLPSRYEGEDISVWFNPSYVADALSVLGTEEVEMSLDGPDAPAVFREPGDEDYLHVVMVMRPPRGVT